LRNAKGRRAVYGGTEKLQSDPQWRDLILFYEYFHGDDGRGIGASHQTGWTGLIARIIQGQAVLTKVVLISADAERLAMRRAAGRSAGAWALGLSSAGLGASGMRDKMSLWLKHSLINEISTSVLLTDLSRRHSRRVTLKAMASAPPWKII
jgi:hypothetical protein